MLSSNTPIRGFYPLALNIPGLLKWIRTFTIRQTSFPLTFVRASVTPMHLSDTFSHVFTELSLVGITVGPLELSVSIFTIGAVVTKVFISTLTQPATLALS
jgi:hypothetical protein